MKQAALLLLFIVGVSGCADLKPMKISGSPTLEERKIIEKQHHVKANFVVSVGGKLISYVQWNDLEVYFRESGCEESARLIPKWKIAQMWTALPVAAGMLLYGASQAPRNELGLDGGMRLMVDGAIGMDLYARIRYLWPAVDSFNDCIRNQLGLDDGEAVER